jgi:hypothetical protein
MRLSGSPKATWVEDVFRDGRGRRWIMAARVWVHRTQLLIGEVRIFPAEREPGGAAGVESGPTTAGNWSGDPLRIPRGGLDTQTLRYARLGGVRPYVLARVQPLKGLLPSELPIDRSFMDYALPGAAALRRPRPRRDSGREDRFYAQLAREYVEMNERGSSRPSREIAERRGEKPERIRDWLHEARERGLLSKGEPGKRGGQLLPSAQALLQAPRSPASRPRRRTQR